MRNVLVVFLLFPLIASAGGEQEVRREDFGDAWPFTVEEGVVTCRGAGSVLFVTNHKTYAVNGLAISDGIHRNIREIWRDNPNRGSYGPVKLSIAPIIDLGLSLCD